MKDSHIDEILRKNFGHVELSEAIQDEMWNNILASVPSESIDMHSYSHRRKHAYRRRAMASVATIAAAAIGGTLVYRTAILSSASDKSSSPQVKSTNDLSSPPVKSTKQYAHLNAAQKYYKNTLGFQPLLPSDIPRGLKTADSSVTVSKNQHGSNGSFSVILCNKNLSGQKTFLSNNKINIFEEPLTQYKQQHSIEQHSIGVVKPSTIRRDGLTLTVYKRKPNTSVALVRGGIRYSVSALSKEYTTNELIKVLESLNVPEKHKPIITQTTVTGSLPNALKTIHFKAPIPTFVPKGFTQQSSSIMGTTDIRTGSFNSAMSEFQILYQNGKASILIDEIRESKGIFLRRSKMTNIKGHQVHVNPHGVGFSWKDSATGVVYNVNATNPPNHSVIDKATLEKVVASMMG